MPEPAADRLVLVSPHTPAECVERLRAIVHPDGILADLVETFSFKGVKPLFGRVTSDRLVAVVHDARPDAVDGPHHGTMQLTATINLHGSGGTQLVCRFERSRDAETRRACATLLIFVFVIGAAGWVAQQVHWSAGCAVFVVISVMLTLIIRATNSLPDGERRTLIDAVTAALEARRE